MFGRGTRQHVGCMVCGAKLTSLALAAQIHVPTRVVSTLAGSVAGFEDGTGTNARFDEPGGIAITPDGSTLFLTDLYNHRIRQVCPRLELYASNCMP